MIGDKYLNEFFDYTLLRPWVADEAFQDFVQHASQHEFRGVCVSPYIVGDVVKALAAYPQVRVGTVVCFPHGNVPLQFKLDQVRYFKDEGVQDIDWVLNYAEVINGNWEQVALEMESMAKLCRDSKMISKCIVETCYVRQAALLTDLYKVATKTGVDFIKTSTGFGQAGADLAHVQLWSSIRAQQGHGPSIKASGGIKTLAQTLDFIKAGADVIGAGDAVHIMEEALNHVQNSANSTEGEKSS